MAITVCCSKSPLLLKFQHSFNHDGGEEDADDLDGDDGVN